MELKQLRSSQGFTLVELLVTVAIVGVLAAISVAQFEEYRKQAYLTHASGLLHNIIASVEAYKADHPEEKLLPPASQLCVVNPTPGASPKVGSTSCQRFFIGVSYPDHVTAMLNISPDGSGNYSIFALHCKLDGSDSFIKHGYGYSSSGFNSGKMFRVDPGEAGDAAWHGCSTYGYSE